MWLHIRLTHIWIREERSCTRWNFLSRSIADQIVNIDSHQQGKCNFTENKLDKTRTTRVSGGFISHVLRSTKKKERKYSYENIRLLNKITFYYFLSDQLYT